MISPLVPVNLKILFTLMSALIRPLCSVRAKGVTKVSPKLENHQVFLTKKVRETEMKFIATS